MFRIKQYTSADFCLNCLDCCRYNSNPSIWAANLLEEEKRALNLKRIEPVAYGKSYICCFLNPNNNYCRIYTHRPLECCLYPFLLNRNDKKLYLGVDLNCRFIKGKTDSKKFKGYLNYLVNYFRSPSSLSILNKNRKIFSTYPEDHVLNLVEIKF